MSKPIISVSGLRGIIGESLDPLLAARFGLAFAHTLGSRRGKVVIGRDGRHTGPMLARSIGSALQAVGLDACYADVCATPTVGVLVRQLDALGGIQISASHNPPEYNGIKLFGSEGRVISADEGQKVINHFESADFDYVPFDQTGAHAFIEDTTSKHLELVLKTVDVAEIRKRKFRVVLDSNHGAGSILAHQLLTDLGCEYEILGDTPDGQFAHVPEPTAENLKGVAEQALHAKADVTFCQDPDADRLAIIDENGNYIGEEYTLAITLKHALATLKKKGDVVINCATSRMSVDLAKAANCNCVVSAVGEANVTNTMISKNAIYGGEGNGGPIDPRVGYVRDSFVAMAQTLDAMAASRQSVSEMVAEIPSYEIVKAKISCTREKVESAFDAIEKANPTATANRQDGLRLDVPDAWLLVRASNTEPIVRVIAEAKTAAEANQWVDKTMTLIEQL